MAALERDRAVVVWNKVRGLGYGAYSTVWLEQCIDGSSSTSPKLRAVKSTQKHHIESWTRELKALARFSEHPEHFVQFLGQDENESSLLIYMEFISHGTLQTCIAKRPLPEHEAMKVTVQLAQALQFMHNAHFIHRDLKPQNVLVSRPGPDWHVKVADFGISKDIAATTAMSAADRGTWAYMAPEIQSNMGGQRIRYTPAVDIWALGATTHCILTREPPFAGDHFQMSDYAREIIPFPAESKALRRCSRLSVEFIIDTMKVNHDLRLTIQQVLAHEWLDEDLNEGDSSSEASDTLPRTASNAWEDTWYPEPTQHDSVLGSKEDTLRPESTKGSKHTMRLSESNSVTTSSRGGQEAQGVRPRDGASTLGARKSGINDQTQPPAETGMYHTFQAESKGDEVLQTTIPENVQSSLEDFKRRLAVLFHEEEQRKAALALRNRDIFAELDRTADFLPMQEVKAPQTIEYSKIVSSLDPGRDFSQISSSHASTDGKTQDFSANGEDFKQKVAPLSQEHEQKRTERPRHDSPFAELDKAKALQPAQLVHDQVIARAIPPDLVGKYGLTIGRRPLNSRNTTVGGSSRMNDNASPSLEHRPHSTPIASETIKVSTDHRDAKAPRGTSDASAASDRMEVNPTKELVALPFLYDYFSKSGRYYERIWERLMEAQCMAGRGGSSPSENSKTWVSQIKRLKAFIDYHEDSVKAKLREFEESIDKSGYHWHYERSCHHHMRALKQQSECQIRKLEEECDPGVHSRGRGFVYYEKGKKKCAVFHTTCGDVVLGYSRRNNRFRDAEAWFEFLRDVNTSRYAATQLWMTSTKLVSRTEGSIRDDRQEDLCTLQLDCRSGGGGKVRCDYTQSPADNATQWITVDILQGLDILKLLCSHADQRAWNTMWRVKGGFIIYTEVLEESPLGQ